jgi:hypothetical protein
MGYFNFGNRSKSGGLCKFGPTLFKCSKKSRVKPLNKNTMVERFLYLSCSAITSSRISSGKAARNEGSTPSGISGPKSPLAVAGSPTLLPANGGISLVPVFALKLKLKCRNLRCKVLTAMKMSTVVFWVVWLPTFWRNTSPLSSEFNPEDTRNTFYQQDYMVSQSIKS